jgi:hypothetical protein
VGEKLRRQCKAALGEADRHIQLQFA